MTVHDVSGVGQPLDLTIEEKEGAVGWLAGGLAITGRTLVATPGRATKLIQAAKASNQVTIEAWVKPANATQRAVRIVTLSAKPRFRNFTLDQDGKQYHHLLGENRAHTSASWRKKARTWSHSVLTCCASPRGASGHSSTRTPQYSRGVPG